MKRFQGAREALRAGLLWIVVSLSVVAGSYGEEPTLVIENAHVIVGDGTVMEDATVVIARDRIQSVSTENLPLKAVKTIDARHRTLMSGLNTIQEMALFPLRPGTPGAAGALMKGEAFQPSRQGVQIYFTTPDVDGTLQRVQERAGKIVLPKTQIGLLGFIASFEDSEGNRIGLRSWSQ